MDRYRIGRRIMHVNTSGWYTRSPLSGDRWVPISQAHAARTIVRAFNRGILVEIRSR